MIERRVGVRPTSAASCRQHLEVHDLQGRIVKCHEFARFKEL